MGARYFTGTFTPRLDEKGRLFLPAKFRVLLTEDVMVSPGQDHCLNVWSMEGFEAMTAEVNRKSQSDRATREYVRYLYSNSLDMQPDKQGRITLSGGMKRYAGIDREVVVSGVMDHVEIWNPQDWAARDADAEQSFAELDGPFGFVEGEARS